jgi:serine protease Do
MRFSGFFVATIAIVIAALGLLPLSGAVQGQPAPAPKPPAALPAPQFSSSGTQPQRVTPTSMGQLQLSFAQVVKKTAPAVVNIYARKIVRPSALYEDPVFRRFFGIPEGGRAGPRKVPSSLGSGVIVRSDGVIVTNNHVVAQADEIMVVLPDKREFEAKVLLADEKSDLAILQINPGGKALPTLRFHDSDNAEVGDIVLAIGNPFGVGQTVTSGIISALARTQIGISDYQFFIQTDAAINPGNSGGALVTLDGGLIGINTAIYSRSGGSVGIGFAIPSNMVKLVVDTALGGGQLRRPWIGVSGGPVTAAIAESLGFDRPQGIILDEVDRNGPAAQAGLKSGDVVTAVDGFEVNDPQAMKFRLATKGVGNSAQVTYWRNSQKGLVNVRLVKAPDTPARDITEVDGPNPLEGAKIGNLNPAFAEELKVDATRGVVVLQMKRNAIAARVGIRSGDIVLEINGEKTGNVDDAVDALSQPQPRGWRLVMERKGRAYELSVPPIR